MKKTQKTPSEGRPVVDAPEGSTNVILQEIRDMNNRLEQRLSSLEAMMRNLEQRFGDHTHPELEAIMRSLEQSFEDHAIADEVRYTREYNNAILGRSGEPLSARGAGPGPERHASAVLGGPQGWRASSLLPND